MKLPLATQTKDGILTNAAQNMAGAKTFYNAAGSTVLGSFSDAGLFTLGSTGSTVTHVLNGNLDFGVADSKLKIISNTETASGIELRRTTGLNQGGYITAAGGVFTLTAHNIQSASYGGLFFKSYNGTTSLRYGEMSSTGAWTLGPSSASGINHTMWGGTNNAASAITDYVMVVRSAASTSATGGAILFRDITDVTQGSITINATANTTAYNTSSDERLKTNPIDFNGLFLIKDMLPKKYERISNPGVSEYGFYAQELNPIYPQAVTVGGDDPEKAPWQIDYSKLVPVMVKALQELKQQFDDYVATHP